MVCVKLVLAITHRVCASECERRVRKGWIGPIKEDGGSIGLLRTSRLRMPRVLRKACADDQIVNFFRSSSQFISPKVRVLEFDRELEIDLTLNLGMKIERQDF